MHVLSFAEPGKIDAILGNMVDGWATRNHLHHLACEMPTPDYARNTLSHGNQSRKYGVYKPEPIEQNKNISFFPACIFDGWNGARRSWAPLLQIWSCSPGFCMCHLFVFVLFRFS